MSEATATAFDGWAPYLDPGERILWQGRPDAGMHIRPRNIVMAVFGTFFAGFALFWMAMAAQAGGGFWLFGILHFAVGAGIVAGAFLWGPWLRRHSVYSLSDRRAFIATDMPVLGRRLKSWPIGPGSPIEFEDGALSTIWFASETRRRSKGGTYQVKIGFERIPDGRAVFGLIRQIQRGSE
jgi:hypothetical protein